MRLTHLALLLAMLAPDCARADELMIDGVRRTYELTVPAGVRASGQPVPLVIALHGGRGSGQQMRAWFGLDAIAAREGFVVAYPDGLERNWNDGRAAVFPSRRGRAPDDVAFLTALAKSLVSRGLARADRIYVTGASNGGMMSYRLACETKAVFAGYAAMIANLSVELAQTCKPAGPARILIMNGTHDPLMPFGGGSVARNNRGEVISTAETYARWMRVAGCRDSSPPEQRPDIDATDGSRIEVTHGIGCAAGGGVTLYTVVGGGHQMPSRTRGSKPIIDALLGTANRDIEAAEEIWAFFAAR
jgi:polyhydroxybutyrate depolymerase